MAFTIPHRVARIFERARISLNGNGPGRILHLIYISFVLPPLIKLLAIYARSYRHLHHLGQALIANREIQRLQKQENGLQNSGASQNFRVLADIDQDGFFLFHSKALEDFPQTSPEKFLNRKRFKLQLVDVRGELCICKEFSGNKLKFLNEVKALRHLHRAGLPVPSIKYVDFDNLTITFSYIPGTVLRETLASRGALLRDRDVDSNLAFAILSSREKRLKRIEEGKKFLSQVVTQSFIEKIFGVMERIHQEGFILNDIKYGNIIIEKTSKQPYFIDFDAAFQYPNTGGLVMRLLKDMDRKLMNLHFDTDYPTYDQLREKIKNRKLPAPQKWYAPAYFGYGLKIGRLWDIDIGDGRWHYILKKTLPDVSGKRVLDLGSNNSFNAIQMLRHGAKEVIGIELDSEHIAQGRFLKETFEWADGKPYNFRYVQANMGDLPSLNLGQFDLVTAFCCIYYLNDQAISKLIKYLSTITEILILQCNTCTNIGRSNDYTYQKASVDYTMKALKANGFNNCHLIAPTGYKRPIVIGKKLEQYPVK